MDDIDFDTVGCWRDELNEISGAFCSAYSTQTNERATLQHNIPRLEKLLASMNKALDDAQGFNDPESEPPVDEDKMKALQHKEKP